MKNLIKHIFPSKDFLSKEAPALSYSLTLNICWLVTEKLREKSCPEKKPFDRRHVRSEKSSTDNSNKTNETKIEEFRIAI